MSKIIAFVLLVPLSAGAAGWRYDGEASSEKMSQSDEMAAAAALRAVRTLQGTSASLAEKLRYAVTSANREIYQTGRQKRRPKPAASLAKHGSNLAPGQDSDNLA